MVAPMVLDGPINGDWFEACVTKVLVPELRPGDISLPRRRPGSSWTTCRATSGQPCKKRSKQPGPPWATLRVLPPYSPDFNPIEKAFSRHKAMLRKAGKRTVRRLWDLIGTLVHIFQPDKCANYFRSCGYGPK
jgi:transposase